MSLKSTGLQSIVKLWPDSDTRDMLPQRCSNCGCAEDCGAAGVTLRFQMRLQRTMRLISMSVLLLLVITLGTLALLMFRSIPFSRQDEPTVPLGRTMNEAVSEKQQSKPRRSHPRALLTMKNASRLEWEDKFQHSEGMSVYSNNLTVHVEGWYRVYFQITFDFNSEGSNNENMCDEDVLNLKVTLGRISNEYPKFRPLLKSKNTMSCKHNWIKSVFTSGTFLLTPNTQLQVEIPVWQRLLINVDETFTFLGAELVSTAQSEAQC